MNGNSFYCPFEDWDIIGVIGHGAQGIVYKAVRHDEHTGDEYAAIKEITSVPEAMVDKVVKEITTLRTLKGSPNILHIEDYKIIKEDESNVYNIYIRTAVYISLEKYLTTHKLNENEVILLGKNICTALEICHKHKIIHRDIKPNNILFNKENNLFYLCDFGIARELEAKNSILTGIGSPNFIAPEVYKGSYDERVDIYSLGLVLYWLMNDYTFPFESDDISDYVRPIRENSKELNRPLHGSEALSAVILKACNYDPNKRFYNVSEMEKSLSEVKSELDNEFNNFYSGKSLTEPLSEIANSKFKGIGASQTVPLANTYDEPIHHYNNNNTYSKSNELPKDADNWDTFLPGEEATQPIEMLNSDMQSHNSQEKKRKLKISNVIIASLVILLLVLLIILLSVIKNSSFKNNSKVNSKPQEEEPLTEDITVDEIITDNTQEIENAIASIIDNVEALSNKNSYDEALGKINEGLKDYPDSEKLQQKKEILEKQIATVHDNETAINEAKELADNNKLVEAIHRIEGAISNSEKNNVSDDSLSKTMNDYTTAYVKQVSDQANELISNTKYDDAIKIVSDALIELPENNALSAKKSQIENEKKKFELAAKKEQVLKEAEEAIASQGYEQAIKILQSVPELSSDPDIKAKIAEYKEFEPVSVFNLIELNRSELKNWTNSLIDTFNNDYTGLGRTFSLNTYTGIDGGSMDEYTFYTEKKYGKLKGKCAVHEDFKGEAELMIYGGKEGYHGDNSTLLYKIKVDRSTQPFDLDVDISDLEWITIDFRYAPRVSTKGSILCVDWNVCK